MHYIQFILVCETLVFTVDTTALCNTVLRTNSTAMLDTSERVSSDLSFESEIFKKEFKSLKKNLNISGI